MSRTHKKSDARSPLVLSILAVANLLLAACGGGNGDSGAGGGTPPPPPPPPPTYSIGGALTGLAGTGLILRNNGGDDLSVAANGAFAFGTELAGGSPYAVTVEAQPIAPVQICTVTNGTGTTASTDVTDVSVTCVTYLAVGGTVSGLTGSGLVLTNNGGDGVSPAADGAFSFSIELPDNTAYAVEVGTQPTSPTQVCTVANGAGTLAGTPITNIEVTCETAYSISGTVTGLGTSGLIVQLNGAEELAVDGSAFQFATTLTSGGSYDVVVLAEPEDRNCTLANGSGVVSGANVVDVSVVCKGWSAAQLIETGPLNAENPQVAVNAGGTAVAVWSQSDGVRLNTWSNLYTPGTGWGSAANIDRAPDVSGNVLDLEFGHPRVAINASGNAAAVWSQWLLEPSFPGVSYRPGVWISRFEPGLDWSNPLLLEPPPTGAELVFSADPQVTLGDDGVSISVWQQTIAGQRIWARIGADVETQVAAGIGNSPDVASEMAPQVARDAAGNAIVVWGQEDPDRRRIWASRFSATTGQWSAPITVEPGGNGDSIHPQIAMNADGDAVVTWQKLADGEYDVWANYFTRAGQSGSWGTQQQLEITFNINVDSGTAPRAAIDSQGNALVIWRQLFGVLESIWFNRYTQSSGWDTAARVEQHEDPDAFGDAFQPQIAMNADGTAIAVWWSRDQINSPAATVWASRYAAAGGWDKPLRLQSGFTPVTFPPTIAPHVGIDAQGNAIAVWARSDGAAVESIWSSRYE